MKGRRRCGLLTIWCMMALCVEAEVAATPYGAADDATPLQSSLLEYETTQPAANTGGGSIAGVGVGGVSRRSMLRGGVVRTVADASAEAGAGTQGLLQQPGDASDMRSSARNCDAYLCIPDNGQYAQCVTDCDTHCERGKCQDTKIAPSFPNSSPDMPLQSSSDGSSSSSSASPVSSGRVAPVSGSFKPEKFKVKMDDVPGWSGAEASQYKGLGVAFYKELDGTARFASRYATMKIENYPGFYQEYPYWGPNGDKLGDAAYQKYSWGPIIGIGNDRKFKHESSSPPDFSNSFWENADRSISSGSSHMELLSSDRQSAFSKGSLESMSSSSSNPEPESSFPLSQMMILSGLYQALFVTSLAPLVIVGMYTRTGAILSANPLFKNMSSPSSPNFGLGSLYLTGSMPDQDKTTGPGRNFFNMFKAVIKVLLLHWFLKYAIAGNSSTGAEITAMGREPKVKVGNDPVEASKHRGLLKYVPNPGPFGKLLGASSFYDRTSQQDSRQTSASSSFLPSMHMKEDLGEDVGEQERTANTGAASPQVEQDVQATEEDATNAKLE